MKFVKKAAAFLFTLAMVVGLLAPAQVAKAETATNLAGSEIKINYEDETLEISTAAALDNIYVTAKYDDTDAKSIAKTVWEAYATTLVDDKHEVIIDFAPYAKATRDTVIYVKGGASVFALKINAQNSTLKAAFSGSNEVEVRGIKDKLSLTSSNSVGNAEYGYIYFTTGKGDTLAQYSTISNIQWKKGPKGTWRALSALDLSTYTNKGTTLYFRIKPTDLTQIGTETDKVYVNTGNRASNEAKLAYAKRATAPKVTISGTSLVLSLKAGQEYSFDGKKWVNVSAAHAVDNKVPKLTPYDLYTTFVEAESKSNVAYSYVPTTADVLYVRTAATTKKIASKTTAVALNAVTDVTSISSKLSVDYATNTNIKSGYVFTNESDKVLQVAVVAKADVFKSDALDQEMVAALNAAGKIKWTTVKAKDDTKNGTGKIYYSSYSKLEDPTIIYRVASIKAVAAKDDNPEVLFQVASQAAVLADPTQDTAAALSAKVEAGSAVGTTMVTATAGEGNKLVYKIVDAEVKSVIKGETITGTALPEGDIKTEVGKFLVVYEVTAKKAAVSFKCVELTTGNIKQEEAAK